MAVAKQGAQAQPGAGAATKPRGGRTVRGVLLLAHRWIGLAAFVWLFMVGLTGFFLGNPQWRWQHQTVIPGLSTPVDELGRQHIRHPREWVNLLSVDPADDRRVLSGGVGGLWFSADRTRTWTGVAFQGLRGAPQIHAIAVDPQLGWDRLLLATDEGIWRLDPRKMSAQREALEGRQVTSLQLHAPSGEVIGVIDYTTLFRYPVGAPQAVMLRDLSRASVTNPPATTTLVKYGFDLHATAGLPNRTISRLVNDYVGLALPTLCLSGFLFWYLPRPRQQAGRRVASRVPVSWMKWLFRTHVFVAGLLVIVPLLYLGLTGIAMGHKFGFNDWAKKISLDSTRLTGNYDLNTLDGEVITVIAPSSDSSRLTALTRLGSINSTDGGANWTYDHDFPLKLQRYWAKATYRLAGGYEIVSDEGNRLFARKVGTGQWSRFGEKSYGLVLDAVGVGDSIYLYTWYGAYRGSPASGFEPVPLRPAPLEGLDFASLVRVIHGLLIYHNVLVWLNDAGAVAAVLLALSGLAVWLMRRRKWV
jgi:hypothetical protein